MLDREAPGGLIKYKPHTPLSVASSLPPVKRTIFFTKTASTDGDLISGLGITSQTFGLDKIIKFRARFSFKYSPPRIFCLKGTVARFIREKLVNSVTEIKNQLLGKGKRLRVAREYTKGAF